MKLDFNSEIPIYLQLAQSVEDDILKGILEEETQIPSTTEISVNYKINPATVGKGFNLLTEAGLIYKKRGVGMFVAAGAREKLICRRKESFFDNYICSLLEEAERLGITRQEIVQMLERGDKR